MDNKHKTMLDYFCSCFEERIIPDFEYARELGKQLYNIYYSNDELLSLRDYCSSYSVDRGCNYKTVLAK